MKSNKNQLSFCQFAKVTGAEFTCAEVGSEDEDDASNICVTINQESEFLQNTSVSVCKFMYYIDLKFITG